MIEFVSQSNSHTSDERFKMNVTSSLMAFDISSSADSYVDASHESGDGGWMSLTQLRLPGYIPIPT